MKKIIYPRYAKNRMKQRGISELEVEHVLEFPMYVKKSVGGRKEAVGEVRKNQFIKVVYIETESYIKIITVKYRL